MFKLIKSQKGSALYFAVAAAVTFGLVAGALLVASSNEVKRSGTNRSESVVEETARSAAQRVFLALRDAARQVSGVEVSEAKLNSIASSMDIPDSDCTFNVQFHNPDQSATKFSVPFNKHFPPEQQGNATEKKIYHFTVETNCGGVVKVANSYISLYSVSAYNWLHLSQFPMQWTPGRSFIAEGKLHSNTGLLVGGYGGVYFSPENRANPLQIAASTSGHVYSMFRIANLDSGWNYNYYHKGYVMTTPYETVRFCINEAYTEGCYLESTPPRNDISVCQEDPEADCYKYTNPINNFTAYNVKIDADNPDFRNRLVTDIAPIKPWWAEALYDPSTGENDPHRVIEPYTSDDTEQDQLHKRWYGAHLRIMDGKSVDEFGNEITTGNLSTSRLKDTLGLFTVESSKYFMPHDGRVADVTTLDLGVFKSLRDNSAVFPEFANIHHIYVGSYNDPSGQVQFPVPGCRPDKADSTWTPVCFDDAGQSCLGAQSDPAYTCDRTQIGTMHAVRVKNGNLAPSSGYQLTTNRTLMIQGDLNTNMEPVVLASDSEMILSNSWDTQSGAPGQGWDPSQPATMGPLPASAVTQNYASLNGEGHALLESWGGNYITRHQSVVTMFRAKDFPPKAGDVTLNNWHNLAMMYYNPATFRSYFYEMGENIDDSDVAVFVGKKHINMIDRADLEAIVQNGLSWDAAIADSSDIEEYPETDPDNEIDPFIPEGTPSDYNDNPYQPLGKGQDATNSPSNPNLN